MANHVQIEVAEAIYTLLTADVTLMALIEGVFDHVPDNQATPFVTINDGVYYDWSSHTFDGFEAEYIIHVWDESRTRKDTMTIQNRIYTLLHTTDLSISGFPTINFRQTYSDITLDPDGRTYHGVQKYNLILGGN